MSQHDPRPAVNALNAPGVDRSQYLKLLADPEVQRLIAEQVQASIKDALDQVRPHAPVSNADANVLSELAASLSEMASQGTGRQAPTPPEVLRKREAADREMRQLIAERNRAIRKARSEGGNDEAEYPLYRVVDTVFLGECRYEAWRRDEATKRAVPVEIFYDGVPNKALCPLNDHAVKIHRLFVESVGGTGVVADKPNSDVHLTESGIILKGLPRGLSSRKTRVGDDFEHPAESDQVRAYRRDQGIVGQVSPDSSLIYVLGTNARPAVANYTGGGLDSDRATPIARQA
jgi:hypothetical protein